MRQVAVNWEASSPHFWAVLCITRRSKSALKLAMIFYMYCCAAFDILRQSLLQRGDAMTAANRSWWQQIQRHRVAIGVVGIILVVAIALVIVVVWFNGTGFDGYTQVTTAHKISGPMAGTVVRRKRLYERYSSLPSSATP